MPDERKAISGVLLDLGGVIYVGATLVPGALEALARLKAAGLPIRYLTNTTRTPRRMMLRKLHAMGLEVAPDELFMPALAARQLLEREGLSPHLLVHPALEEDFEGDWGTCGNAVVVGDAAEGFTFAAMNAAFRALMGGARFLALARNRSFMDADGELSIDAGAFVTALEYATGRAATVLGKPSPGFFAAALAGLDCGADQAVMVGDDVEADVAGAQAAGITGILVRTGKYRPGDESSVSPSPDAVAENIGAAVEWILARAGPGVAPVVRI